jgi:tRNA G18 (ribose-2'-O)-methylase SpoU
VLIPIADPSDPRIADYTGLRDAHTREQHLTISDPAAATFIAEGELVVRQLIASGLTVRSILLTPMRIESIRAALAQLPPATPVYSADQPVLNAITGFNIHRGILAAGHRPSPPDLGALLGSSRALVVLEDLSNHDNVGGIFRATAALAGLGTPILLSPRCCDPLYRKAIRVSMGTVLRLPFARLDPWPTSLALLRPSGFTSIALTPARDALPIGRLPPVPRPAILLGAEGPGLSPGVLTASDFRVRIPIDPRTDSLNVATAAAIALHRLCPALQR